MDFVIVQQHGVADALGEAQEQRLLRPARPAAVRARPRRFAEGCCFRRVLPRCSGPAMSNGKVPPSSRDAARRRHAMTPRKARAPAASRR
jgi:hypothetical protein